MKVYCWIHWGLGVVAFSKKEAIMEYGEVRGWRRYRTVYKVRSGEKELLCRLCEGGELFFPIGGHEEPVPVEGAQGEVASIEYYHKIK